MKGRATVFTSHFAAESKSKIKRKRGASVLIAPVWPTHRLTLRFFPKTDWSIHNPAIQATSAIALSMPSLYRFGGTKCPKRETQSERNNRQTWQTLQTGKVNYRPASTRRSRGASPH